MSVHEFHERARIFLILYKEENYIMFGKNKFEKLV